VAKYPSIDVPVQRELDQDHVVHDGVVVWSRMTLLSLEDFMELIQWFLLVHGRGFTGFMEI